MAMAVGGSGGGVNSDINVTPMIDVMLVLLVIFMIVTPIISSGFQLKMPQGKNIEARPEEGGDVVLGIDSDGNLYFDPGTGEVSPVDQTLLAEALENVYMNREDRILYFKADANLDYGTIEDVLAMAREAGVRVLATIVEEDRSELFGRGR